MSLPDTLEQCRTMGLAQWRTNWRGRTGFGWDLDHATCYDYLTRLIL